MAVEREGIKFISGTQHNIGKNIAQAIHKITSLILFSKAIFSPFIIKHMTPVAFWWGFFTNFHAKFPRRIFFGGKFIFWFIFCPGMEFNGRILN